jgi:hypothetical protein
MLSSFLLAGRVECCKSRAGTRATLALAPRASVPNWPGGGRSWCKHPARGKLGDAPDLQQREIESFAIAAKRYGLYIRRPDGIPQIVRSGDKLKRSEHGLGHLLPPNALSPRISDRVWLDAW